MTADDELCVLVLAPRGRDASLAAQLLVRHGMCALACDSAGELAARVTTSGCAIVTEEALLPAARDVLRAALADQPPWSDYPVIMFAPRFEDRVSDAFAATRALGNVTVLERPVQSRSLISAVGAALRGRRRQYEARAAIERRDQFLAMLGHELRNPLASIVLATEMLNRGDMGQKARTILDRQTKHLSRLVDDLLDVARVTKGKVTLQRALVDVHDVLARCVQSAELVARARSSVISMSREDAPLLVDGDPVRLEEVFSNLIGNAIKYSPERAHVEIEVRREAEWCVVEVVDAGVGIAPEMLPHVFDLFAQGPATLDRSQGGLGIGLTVVKALVELHGGTVEAESEGHCCGSTFRVTLPLARDAAATAVPLHQVSPQVVGR